MARDPVFVQIKTPSGADSSVRSFVVGITDLIPVGYGGVRIAEEQYKTNVRKWKRLVAQLRVKRSDALLRWRLGNGINRFFQILEKRRGIIVTNQLEALSHDLGLSHDAVGFIVRAPVLFSKSEIEQSGLTWLKFQELMGIKDPSSRRQCFRLLHSGKIKDDKEIRAFKRVSNRTMRH